MPAHDGGASARHLVRERLRNLERLPEPAPATLRGILHCHPGERILIAAHGETVEAAHGFFLQIPAPARLGIGFVTDHASSSRRQLLINRFERHVWMLVAHNDTQHLTCEKP